MLILMMLKSGTFLNIGLPLQKILHTQVVGEATCQSFWWTGARLERHCCSTPQYTELAPRPEVTEHGNVDRLMMSASPFG